MQLIEGLSDERSAGNAKQKQKSRPCKRSIEACCDGIRVEKLPLISEWPAADLSLAGVLSGANAPALKCRIRSGKSSLSPLGAKAMGSPWAPLSTAVRHGYPWVWRTFRPNSTAGDRGR